MSYEKQTWANGDVITADKLNHIENGVDAASFPEATKEALTLSVGNCFVIHVVETDNGYETVETCAEIYEAFDTNGKLLYIPEICPMWEGSAEIYYTTTGYVLNLHVQELVYIGDAGFQMQYCSYRTDAVAEADAATSKFVIPYDPTFVFATTLTPES